MNGRESQIKHRTAFRRLGTVLLLCPAFAGVAWSGSTMRVEVAANAGYKVLGWNNLGMHCVDSDFSVFTILPPYNTIHAQVIDDGGRLVNPLGGIRVTYEAAADPNGSINTTSAGKTNFWQHVEALFGITLPVDEGLPVPGPDSFAMPGVANTPQAMGVEAASGWFAAYGIPIVPIDDLGHHNPYPLMRLTAWAGTSPLGSSDVVLPVSDEMNCRACHASGVGPAAMPTAGWVFDPDSNRDFRLNVLRLHDERNVFNPLFQQALASAGYNPDGLYASVVSDGVPLLCARCHLSEALPGSGVAGVSPLTQVMHTVHSHVVDPATSIPLDAVASQSACYYCHPGAQTHCLRGAMARPTRADGSLVMPCQSCHGLMSRVGAPNRTGWLDEPTCQNCHTGTAVRNNGQIRYESAFDSSGQLRQAVSTAFATDINVPAPGHSLYRHSTGHGGLYCQACHGPTHAEFPSLERNDNLSSIALEGHDGMLVECQACHASPPETIDGGPHGLHPVGQGWVKKHGEAAEGEDAVRCQACHGTDYRGTVLSSAQADRTFDGHHLGTRTFSRGQQIGCHHCHGGLSGKSNGGSDAGLTAARISTHASVASLARDPQDNLLP